MSDGKKTLLMMLNLAALWFLYFTAAYTFNTRNIHLVDPLMASLHQATRWFFWTTVGVIISSTGVRLVMFIRTWKRRAKQ